MTGDGGDMRLHLIAPTLANTVLIFFFLAKISHSSSLCISFEV